MNILLSGVIGSTAYGLAGPTSDVDRLGIFAAPTAQLHGLRKPKESHVSTDPDRTLHEAGKAAHLMLGCNPTVLEILYLDSYETRTHLGDELIAIRTAFLSAKRVRDAYLGYSVSQFKRLESRGDGSFSADTRNRTAKHARHLARLLHQGRELYATGQVTVKLENPLWFLVFGEQVACGDLEVARKLLADAEAYFDATTTPLPDEPDTATVEAWLRRVRVAYWEPEPTGQTWLVDLDGTTALREPDGRSPYDWDRVGEDHPNAPVVTVVRALAAAGHRIVYMSGRSEDGRAPTNVWIAAHIGVPGEALLMRPAGDHRPDHVVKRALYEVYVKPRWGQPTGVFDDRAKVVGMWRELGLTVMQVAPGDF